MNLLHSIAVIGAGTMGRSIAQLFLQVNVNVLLIDEKEESLKSAEKLIESQLGWLYNKGILYQKAEHFISLLEVSKDFSKIKSASFVIEAIPEKLELKQELFQKLEHLCNENTIFATNTSGLSITEISTKLNHPERLVGTHFYTPAAIVPLVEVVKGKKTSDLIAKKTMEILTEVGKKPVLLHKEVPGFIGNRIQHAIAREAISLLESEVATVEDIDTVVKWSVGLRMALTGPFEQRDVNGLDIHYDIASYLYRDLSNHEVPSKLLQKKVETGQTGLKAGKGFYNWKNLESKTYLNNKEEELIELVHWLSK